MTSKTSIIFKIMNLTARVLLLLLLACWFGTGYAQRGKGQTQEVLDWAAGIVVDGRLEDWGDTLLYENSDQGLQYHLRNDDEHLFVALRVRDREQQIQALSQGFSVMVNTRGRKREGPTVVYPIADRIAFRSIMSADNDDRPEDMREGALQAIRSIYVLRFDDILDGQLSLANNYGIQAETLIDSTDALCAEIVIPLYRLGLSVQSDQRLAVNVKINGLIMPSTPGGNYGMRGRYRGYGYYPHEPQGRSKPRAEPGVWIVSPLAKE